MTRQQIQSNHIQSIGHDPMSGLLEVEFMNGSVYQYGNVGVDIYNRIMSHPSAGTAFANIIRNNPKGHPFRKVR